jgi:hypothetical protein
MLITFESRKKSYPAYVFVFTYALAALVFKDRWQYLIGLLMALGLFLGAYGLGKRLSFLVFKTADQSLYFPIGLGIVLLVFYFLSSFSISRTISYSIWGLLGVLSVFELPVLTYRLNRNYFWASPLILLAFWASFTPSTNPTTLGYFLGLPHQFFAAGKIQPFPYNLYSSLAPFGSSLTLLFSSVGFDCGVKAFSLILYFQIISIVVALLRWLITEPVFASGNGRDQEYQTDLMYMTRMELLVIPMLLFPGIFALFHNQTYDLLAALFFCAAISSLIKEYDVITALKIWNIGLLIAFALWTKTGVLLYVPWIALLWFGLMGWRISKENWKILAILFSTTLLFWLPVPIRNTIHFGDPFYPALSGILTQPNWTPAQSVLFEKLVMSEPGGLLDALSNLAALVFHPAGIGLVMLIALAIYPFSRKVRVMNHVIFFAVGCYVTWGFIFQEFRHFLPVYVLLFPVSYFAFRHLYIRSPRYLWIVWALCILSTAVPLLTFFRQTPLILPEQSQEQFLTSQVDYYPIATSLKPGAVRGEILILGDSRIAYYRQRVLAGSPFDSSVILPDLRASVSPEELLGRLKRRGIRYIVLREDLFEQLYGPSGVFPLTEMQIQNWRTMLKMYSTPGLKSGYMQLFELTGSQTW